MRIGSFYIEDRYHRWLYIAALCFTLASLPFYRAMSSIGVIVMAANWILEGHFREKWQRLKSNPGIWILASFYLTGVLGVFYSEEFRQVVQHLQNGLAFLAAPLVIGTSGSIKLKELKLILASISVSVLINSFVSYSIFAGFIDVQINTFRDYSYFSSNVHLTYLVIVTATTLFYLVRYHKPELSFWEYTLAIALTGWMVIYVYFLRSFSGIITMSAVIWIVLFVRFLKMKHFIKYPALLLMLLAPLFPVYVFQQVYAKNFQDYEIKRAELEKETAQGNKYHHNLKNKLMENGHYVGLYNSRKELREEWNKRSDIDFDAKDKKGQPLYATLIRYMTAKGLKKDAEGMKALSPQDIRNVEKGHTNPIYASPRNFYYNRIYTIAQSFDIYLKTGKPFDSVTKRAEAYQAMISIFKDHPIVGVGNGDIKKAYDEYFSEKYENADKMNLVGGHNQYLKILATFGLLGFAWFIFAFAGSWIVQKGHRYFMTRMVFFILLLAMISEVPLDQQRPAILFSIFISLFLFSFKPADERRKRGL